MKIIEAIRTLINEEREEARSPLLPTERPLDEMAAIYWRRTKIFLLLVAAGLGLFLIVLIGSLLWNLLTQQSN